VKYKIPEPRECLNCGGQAYARQWFSSTTTGREYGGDVVKVYWKCSQCGRRFETMEHLDSIMIEVAKLPESRYAIAYYEEEE